MPALLFFHGRPGRGCYDLHRLLSPALYEPLLPLLAGGTRPVFERSGHFPCLEEPADYCQTVTGFVLWPLLLTVLWLTVLWLTVLWLTMLLHASVISYH